MSDLQSLTALVLAGSRPGGDPLAAYADVSHKALIQIGGVPMLERVLRALAATPQISRIVVAIERPELVAALPDFGKPVVALAAASGPSASVAAALAAEGTPLLVTTADHALLKPEWLQEFLRKADDGADVSVGLARRAAVIAAVPDTQRTYLRFADDHYSGCNLFLMRHAAAGGVIALWQQIEAERKRPLKMLTRLGFGYALRYRFGWLRLDQALARLGTLAQARVGFVDLQDGLAAVDVDKPADLDLVRRLVA